MTIGVKRTSRDPNEQDRDYGDVASDYARALGQGITFGFADEIEAVVKSSLDSGKSYSETVKDVRAKIQDFRKRAPAAAWGLEISASILPMIGAQFIPGVGQAATAGRMAQLGRTALTSGIGGTVYGAGASKGTVRERVPDALTTGAISAVAGPAMQAVAPAVTSKAADLIKRGIPVTPGQAVRGSGLLGTAYGRLEEQVAGTVPFIGDAIRGAFDRARKGFNRASVTEALQPLGVRVPRNLEGRELISFGQKLINKSYDNVLEKMEFQGANRMDEAILEVVEDIGKDIQKDILDRVDRYIIYRFKNDKMSGAQIKRGQSYLRRDIQRLRKSGNEVDARKADALEDVSAIFSHELAKQNPAAAQRLNKVDQAYGNFEIVRNAALRRKVDEDFVPGDLLQAVAKGDPTKRQSQFSSGQARLQPFAQRAQDVLGRTAPDSGTAGRLQAARIVTGGGMAGGMYTDPTVAVPSIALPATAYSQAGVPITRSLVNLLGKGMRQAVPVVSAQVPQTVQEQLAKALLGK